MLLFVTSLKLVLEIALLALAGRWAVGWLAGPRRERNLFYRLFEIVASPLLRAVGSVAPAALRERHLAVTTFVLLGLLWIALTAVKIGLCLRVGISACR